MSYSQFRHWVKANILGGQITQYHPDFVKKLNQIEKLSNNVQSLIKAIRNLLDPNLRWPYNPAKLAHPDLNETVRYIQHMGSMGDCCTSEQPKSYFKLCASVEKEIDAARILFVRQVETYSIAPLNKFVKEDAVLVRTEKKSLDKCRADYDNACDYLRQSHEGNIDQKNANLEKCKGCFEKQADVIQTLLDKFPAYEKSVVEATKLFIKSYRQLQLAIKTAVKKLKL